MMPIIHVVQVKNLLRPWECLEGRGTGLVIGARPLEGLGPYHHFRPTLNTTVVVANGSSTKLTVRTTGKLIAFTIAHLPAKA